MIAALWPIIASAIDKVLDKIPDPGERDAARLAIKQQVASAEQEFRSFILAYEGKASDVPPALQIYRGSVRPTLTYGLAVAFVAALFRPDLVSSVELGMLFNLNLVSLAFWYGERSLRGIGVDVKAMVGRRRRPLLESLAPTIEEIIERMPIDARNQARADLQAAILKAEETT